MKLIVVSWNLNHWQRSPQGRAKAWDYLANELRADVALVQEAGPPPTGWHHVGSHAIDATRAWGTLVVSPAHPLKEVTQVKHLGVPAVQPYRTWKEGTAATATTMMGGRELTFVSLYGLLQPRNAYESINRHLADVGPLLDSPRHLRRTVIGGDLNLTTQWTGEQAAYAPIDRALLDQFRAYGLRDLVSESATSRLDGCPCLDAECRHRQTWWQRGGQLPRQNDYMFVSKRFPGEITLDVDSRAVDLGYSDHAPLIASLDW